MAHPSGFGETVQRGTEKNKGPGNPPGPLCRQISPRSGGVRLGIVIACGGGLRRQTGGSQHGAGHTHQHNQSEENALRHGDLHVSAR